MYGNQRLILKIRIGFKKLNTPKNLVDTKNNVKQLLEKEFGELFSPSG